jgi:sulfate adenylyltransferase
MAKGWKTVVAFQTRNAPHRSHEFLQKLALDQADGLFIQPVVGRKKRGDFRDEIVLAAYRLILDKYYPKNRTHLGVLPLRMRYAGPREAVFHALIRKNYGCTHFIVGRDHAGVGDYYGPYDAHKIFDNFKESEIGIKILKFDNAFHCRECGGLVTADKCHHPGESRLLLSGTQLREMIQRGESIPVEFMRSEVVEFLMKQDNPFLD